MKKILMATLLILALASCNENSSHCKDWNSDITCLPTKENTIIYIRLQDGAETTASVHRLWKTYKAIFVTDKGVVSPIMWRKP
jgi:hypothetical protein